MTSESDDEAEQAAAWGDPSWVLAVMHYPGDAKMRKSYRAIRSAQLTKSIEPAILDQAAAGMDGSLGRTATQGHVAGMVLSLLYTMGAAPWGLGEASLRKAIHLTEHAGRDLHESGRSAPYGKTEIRECLNAMRPVAHLWAAWRLHLEWPTRDQRELLEPKGLPTLLEIARGVQDWALVWKPSRARTTSALLGNMPWLVPDNLAPKRPPWGPEPPTWMSRAMGKYRHPK